MDTGFEEVVLNGHPECGGSVALGVCEENGKALAGFDGVGDKEEKCPCPESGAVESQSGGQNERFLSLRFERPPGEGAGCRWLLNLGEGSLRSLIREIYTWANSRAKLNNGAVIELKSCENRKMELRIAGRGKDGRCRWCRTFRSGLKTAVRRKYGRQAFILDGACIFDGESGMGS